MENPNVSVLEIGPGYGTMSLAMLQEYPDFTMDWLLFPNEVRIEDGRQDGLRFERELKKIEEKYPDRVRHERTFFELDGIPWKKQYDMIVLTDVFEHFALNPIENLEQLKEHLSRDGMIVLTTPNAGHIHTYESWRDMPFKNGMTRERYGNLTDAMHAYQYDYAEMEEIINESGLSIKEYRISDSNTHNFQIIYGDMDCNG